MGLNPSSRERILYELGQDPVLAHAVLFAHKHSDATPAFHHEIIRDWHSDKPNVLTLAFREAGKSTICAEEATIIEACFRRIRNGMILGESEQRAVDRLRAIKHEFETNEEIQALFELGPGDIWTEAKITLTNGVMLQAYGRGQSLRGVKHLDARPDWLVMDDLEDNESVATPEARSKTKAWYATTVIPALDRKGRKRMVATPLHPEALAPTFAKAASWHTKIYPIVYKSPEGEDTLTWPERYSFAWVERKKQEMAEVGQADAFVQEYLCEAQNPATQVFTPEMIRVVPQPRSWHAVYAMYDPARTTHAKSATTGKAVWSWIGRKLVIWDGFAKRILPDEIVADMFETDDRYHPVAIGVEETGLNEWLQQPIRTEQVVRGHLIPLRALNAPKGKLDFIRGLQPYFKAGEVEFAADLPDLKAQLLGFPTGAIDFPNALAYALRLRAGLPVYDGFGADNISEDIAAIARAPLWLACNSDGRVTTAVLCQLAQGQLSVLADWLADGDPGTALADILMEARVELPTRAMRRGEKASEITYDRQQLRFVAPRVHWEGFGRMGLLAAAKKIPATFQRGGEIVAGREEIRRLFRLKAHGAPAIRVAARATWTLRAFSGGFCRQVGSDEPEANSYRVLIEGLEAFAGSLRAQQPMDSGVNFAYTASGQKYISANPRG